MISIKTKSILFVLSIVVVVISISLLYVESSYNKEILIKKTFPSDYVDLSKFIPDLVIDVRYATSNNFMNRVLKGYKSPRALMLRSAAQRLKRVQKSLKSKGYSLKIFDAYRPMRAERDMIDWSLKKKYRIRYLREGYVPARVWPGRKIGHVSGNTVDLTLVDSHGKEINMGTAFDAFTKKSWTSNAKGTVLKNRLLLKKVMEAEGFRNYYREWWHFVHPQYPSQAQDFVIE